MAWAFVYLACYAAVIWWLRDGGRTPIAAITMHRLSGWFMDAAQFLGGCSLEFQLAARHLIEKRRLV
jgi:hypothetical protein